MLMIQWPHASGAFMVFDIASDIASDISSESFFSGCSSGSRAVV